MIEKFFLEHASAERPLGLAYSGGADSRFLLEQLLPLQGKCFARLHLLHVDHSLRPSSAAEADAARSLASALSLPFHLETLEPSALSGNLESACREKRYAFFAATAQKEGLQAVCTAHHADDQSETALKKMVEGGRIDRLGAMRPLSFWGAMPLWRPLLNIRKSQILLYLRENKIAWFEDETNESSAFLRGKMRNAIFPFLTAQFDKELQKPLLRLAEEGTEFSEWIAVKAEEFVKEIGPGVVRFLGPFEEPFLLKMVLREVCRKADFSLSVAEEKELLAHLIEGSANKWFNRLYLDRKVLFFKEPCAGRWELKEVASGSRLKWEALVSGSATIRVPFRAEGVVDLQAIQDESFKRRIREKLSKAKAPHILWPRWPLILGAEGQAYEPLTETLSPAASPCGSDVFYQLRRLG